MAQKRQFIDNLQWIYLKKLIIVMSDQWHKKIFYLEQNLQKFFTFFINNSLVDVVTQYINPSFRVSALPKVSLFNYFIPILKTLISVDEMNFPPYLSVILIRLKGWILSYNIKNWNYEQFIVFVYLKRLILDSLNSSKHLTVYCIDRFPKNSFNSSKIFFQYGCESE